MDNSKKIQKGGGNSAPNDISNRGLRYHFLRVGISRASAQAVVFLSLPVLARLYNPEDFGVWALIQSTALIVGSVATLRFELAVVLPQDHNEAFGILGIGIGTAFLLSIMCIALIPWALPLVMGDQKIADMRIARWAIPALVFFIASNQLGLSWCTRTTAFGVYGGSQLLLALAGTAIPAWLAFHPSSTNGLVLGTVLSIFSVQVGLWAYIITDIIRRDLSASFSRQNVIELLSKYRSYPLYMTPYTMIGAIRERIIYFFIGHYGGAGEVGLYSMAQRLTNSPNSLVVNTIRPVFFQFAVNQVKEKVHEMVHGIMFKLVFLVVPLMTFYFFYPERLLTLLLGQEWAIATPYTLILMIPLFPLLLGNWMDRYLDVLGHQRLAFLMETIFSVAAVAAISIAFYMDASVPVAVSIQAGILGLYFTVWIAIVFRIAAMPISGFFYVLIIAACIFFFSAIILFVGNYYGGMLLAAISLAFAWVFCVVNVFWNKG